MTFFSSQVKLPAKLYAQLSRIVVRALLPVRDKENSIACFQSCKRGQLLFELLWNKLVNRSLVRPVLCNLKIAKTPIPMPVAKSSSFSWKPFDISACTLIARTVLPIKGLNEHFWKKPVTSRMRSGFLKSGLSVPNSSIAC